MSNTRDNDTIHLESVQTTNYYQQRNEYEKIKPKQYVAKTLRETNEGKYWKQYKTCSVQNQPGIVTSVFYSGSPEDHLYPQYLTATSSARVTMYAQNGKKVLKTFARFKDVAFSGVLRKDAKVLAVGGQSGIVQLFDVKTRNILRKFTLHQGAVRAVRWSETSNLSVASSSDDTTVRIWDVSTGNCSQRFDGHKDYVRALESNPEHNDIWATGSYDHSIRLWDQRVGRDAVMVMKHTGPVEDICWYPNARALVSCGGPEVIVWDVIKGASSFIQEDNAVANSNNDSNNNSGNRLMRLTNHQKTVMTVNVHRDCGPRTMSQQESFFENNRATDENQPRLITGSLDGHVKVHEIDGFTVTHAAKFPGPVLCCAISPDANAFAVGLASKTLCVRKRTKARIVDVNAKPTPGPGAGKWKITLKNGFRIKRPRRMDAGTTGYFTRSGNSKPTIDDEIVMRKKRVHLQAHDRALRKFKFGEALDAALGNGRPEVVMAVIEDIERRGGIVKSLANREEGRLVPVLEFIVKYVANPRHTKDLVRLSMDVLDLYGSDVGTNKRVDRCLNQLRERVMLELRLEDTLDKLSGMCGIILNSY
jgi:U3 small nucleolar RNA-associated protein 15